MQVLLQTELLGRSSVLDEIKTLSCSVSVFSGYRQDWKSLLLKKEKDPAWQDGPCVLFCSLQVARFVQKHCPHLSRGLFFRPEAMSLRVLASSFASSPGLWLNEGGFWLPFGVLERSGDFVFSCLGERVFVRPDSGLKTFSAFVADAGSWALEVSSVKQIHNPSSDEMVFCAPAKDLETYEHRFWCVGGEPVANAPYAFGPGGINESVSPSPPPPDAWNVVGQAAQSFLAWDDVVVVDVVVDKTTGVASVVECNALSTSGFYQGFKIKPVLEALSLECWGQPLTC